MRVVIAEDLVLLRQGLARLLGAEGIDVVAQVGDAPALVAAVVATRPDLAVVDVRMPPSFTDEGARAVPLLRARFPELAVVVLSHIVETRLALTLTEGGTTGFGYLLKDRVLDLDEFVETLRRVAGGGTAIDPAVVAHLMGGASGVGTLTPREREVLGLIAEGLSNAAIARRLVVSERTVDAHVRAVMTKLDIAPDAAVNRRVLAALTWLGRAEAR